MIRVCVVKISSVIPEMKNNFVINSIDHHRRKVTEKHIPMYVHEIKGKMQCVYAIAIKVLIPACNFETFKGFECLGSFVCKYHR